MSAFPLSPHGKTNRPSGSMLPFETEKPISGVSDKVNIDLDTAVVSSEDEHDGPKPVKPYNGQTSTPGFPKGPRRSSFLNELQPDPKRRPSFNNFSPAINLSQPPTPSTDNNLNSWAFGNTLTKVPSNGSGSGWSQSGSIWGNDISATSQIGHPLAPTASLRDRDLKAGSPIGGREEDVIPFSIPLHPTPKAYRSQSYSVGQMESDLEDSETPAVNRGRATQTGVRHKPSRLNEVEHALEELNEGDDEGSDNGVLLGSPRLWDAGPYAAFDSPPRDSGNEARLHKSLTLPPLNTMNEAQALEQRTSGNNMTPFLARTQWHTMPAFDHLQELPASRRHSMADVTLGRGPTASEVPVNAVAYAGRDAEGFRKQASDIEDNMAQSDMNNRAWAQQYFSGSVPAARSQIEATQRPAEPVNPRSMAGPYRGGPQPSVFTRPGFDTPLYIVAFKCARADIYYIQPGTGLDINEGDLVMVEADRGYDLGTVTHARVSWARARELKEIALDEHFRWLMMFSRHNQDIVATDPQAVHGLLAQKGPTERDPIQKGFGLGVHDPQYSHDIKPRMIKRRAFNYEIANLREKEGNEAKAKRSCQQKARDNGYQMEILDAEFQIDWKKLTFYFYAPDYVNFNPLVTDLYKIYKVRIWMSAINPGTYPSPANKPPSSIGPGAMEGRDTPVDNGGGVINDPDPDGAVPPHLNPASATYREMNKEAAARSMNSQNAFHPINPVAFHQNNQRNNEGHNYPQWSPAPSQQGVRWSGMDTAEPNRGAFNSQFSPQAVGGAQYNQPAPRAYMPQPIGPPGMGPSPMSYAPWNPQPHQSPAPRGLNPLAPPASLGGLGGDWMARGFGSMNLNDKKR